MKVTKNIKLIIVRQFKDGYNTEYLAKLYGLSLQRVEGIIREWMNNQEAR